MISLAHYRALLFAQWKQQRVDLWVMAVVGAAIAPMAMWTVREANPITAFHMRNVASAIGFAGSALAIIAGALLALRPYALDALLRHTYALSLPVPRSAYATARVAAGITLLVIPFLGFGLGATIAANAIALPPMIHAYPVGLAVRFLMASVFAFALAFGVQYGLGQRAAKVIALLIGFVGAVELIGQLLLSESLVGPAWRLITSGMSPFQIFGSHWMLFDV